MVLQGRLENAKIEWYNAVLASENLVYWRYRANKVIKARMQ